MAVFANPVVQSKDPRQLATKPINRPRSQMTCRIERVADGENFIVFRVTGRIQSEHVETLRQLFAKESGRVAVDLAEVTLVDWEVVAMWEGEGWGQKGPRDFPKEGGKKRGGENEEGKDQKNGKAPRAKKG